MSEITQNPRNPRRYHHAFEVTDADYTDYADLVAAGLVILGGDGEPTETENYPAVEIVNDGEDGVDPDVYLYHANDATDAAMHGRRIAPGEAYPDISRTPRYLFTASGTATVRVTALDYRSDV